MRTLDNYAAGKRENLEPFRDRIEMIEGDVRSPFAVMEAVHSVPLFAPRRPCPPVPRSVKDPFQTTNEVGVVGTLVNVLKAAVDQRRKESGFRLVVSSIYGNSEVLYNRRT